MGKTYTIDDIQELLKGSELDIKAMAKIANVLNNEGNINEQEKKIRAKTPTKPAHVTTWKLVVTKYPDFAIEKKMASTTRRMCIMPSINTYYIQDTKTESVETLNAETYSKFTAGMDIINMPEDFWIKTLESGKAFWLRLWEALKIDTYRTMIKDRCAPKFEDLRRGWRDDRVTDDRIDQYEKFGSLIKEFKDNQKANAILNHKRSTNFIQDMIENFGLENTRDFFNELNISLIEHTVFEDTYVYRQQPYSNIVNDKYTQSCRPRMIMEYKKFKSYVLYQSVQMGYARSISTFMEYWRDVLSMQHQIYGKVKDKYPDNLPLLHQQLSYKKAVCQEQIDIRMFTAQSEKTQKYEMCIGDYIFIAPRTRADMIDEATQQANCLAGYTGKYARGEDHIIFMRYKKDPTKSLVTIELIDDKINQRYQAHNRILTVQQKEITDKWLEKVKLINAGTLNGEKLEALQKSAKKIINRDILGITTTEDTSEENQEAVAD